MSVLIIGPSSSGKSTYLKHVKAREIYFGHQLLKKEIPISGFIHYNLLHFATTFQKQNDLIPSDWKLLKEPILKKIIDSGKVSKAIIIICQLGEIKKRIEDRIYVEQKINPREYPRDLWRDIYSHINLNLIYLKLFDLLKNFSNCEYLISRNNKNFKVIHDINLVKQYLKIDTQTKEYA